ncbi:MAG: DUF5715 family protein [Terracidiphilus sp.]|jgi:hypothetical protein
MGRTIYTAFVVAALSVSSANGSSVSRAKAHKHAHVAPTTHSVQDKAARPTPEEVGRAAGLKIRRDLARRHTAQAAPHSPQRVHSSQARPQSHPPTTAKAVPNKPERIPSRAQIASAKAEPFALKPAPHQAPAAPFVEPGPFAETAGSSVDEPAAEPAPSTEADTPAKDSVSASSDSESRAAEAPTGDVSALGDLSQQAKSLTRRAAIQAVSLHTSRFGMPPPLIGSRANLEHQNAMSDAEGLERIEDEDDLADRIAKKLLVPVPTSLALTINGNLPVNHRYCRPWTALFLADLARSHAVEFHRPLEVSSAVRTVAYQKRLMEINGNAAAAEGDIVSPHLTGATIDIAKGPLSRQEIAWMRVHLLPLEQAGKIDVEEEFQQACFHITVYKSYAPPSHRTSSGRVPPARAAHQRNVQTEIALADTAQTDAIEPDAVQSGSAHPGAAHVTHSRRRHTHRRTVARAADASSGVASRGL